MRDLLRAPFPEQLTKHCYWVLRQLYHVQNVCCIPKFSIDDSDMFATTSCTSDFVFVVVRVSYPAILALSARPTMIALLLLVNL